MTSSNTGNMTDKNLESKAKKQRILEHLIFFSIFLLLSIGLFFMVYKKAKPIIEITKKSDIYYVLSSETQQESASDAKLTGDSVIVSDTEDRSDAAIEKEENAVSYISTLYQAPTALSDNIFECIFELDGHLYRLPCPVTEFLDNGWTVDNYTLTGGNYANCVLALKKGTYRLGLTSEGNSGEKEDDFSNYICTSIDIVFGTNVDSTVFRMNEYLYSGAPENDIRNKYKGLNIVESTDEIKIRPISEADYIESVTITSEEDHVTGFFIFCKSYDKDILEELLYTDKYPKRYDYDNGAWDQMEYNDQYVLIKLTHNFADGIVEDTVLNPDIEITTSSWEWNDKNKSRMYVCGTMVKKVNYYPDGEWSEVVFEEDGTAKQSFYSADGEIKETKEWQYK